MIRTITAAIAILAMAGAADAQDATFAAFMRQVNANVPLPEQHVIYADALETVQAIAREEAACVPTGVELDKPTPATATRLAVQGIQSGQLKNAWMTYGRLKGCQSPSPIRFVILLMANDEVRVRQVNEGESIASMSLMRDTSASTAVAALTAVRAVKSDCVGAGMKMVGTRVISKSADLSPDFYGARYAGSWEEGWTFEVCGRRAEVPVGFRADGMGGAFSEIRSAAIRVLE